MAAIGRTRWWRELALVNRRGTAGAVARITVWPTSGSRQKVPKTAWADFNGGISTSLSTLLPQNFWPPRNPYPWARRVNGAHSLLRSFIPLPPSLFLVSTLLWPRWRAPGHCCCIKSTKKKKTSFDRSFSLRFLLSTRFYSISFPKSLEIFLKFLATVCWYKLSIYLPVLIVRILKKFSKFALAISHPSRNASKATSVAIVLRAIVFLFFFF